MTEAIPGGPPPLALLHLLYGAQSTQLAYVMAKLGLADLLHAGPQRSRDLATVTQTDPQALLRVLRGLTSLGLCTQVDAERFALTTLGAYLCTDRPDSLHARALFNGEVLFPLWGDLLRTVRTGEASATRVLGMPLYQYLAEQPEVGALFDRTMASYAHYRLPPAVRAYDFSRFRTIVDVGGGNGALLVQLLHAHAQPRGIVFDLPAVVERARMQIEAAGLSERCTAIGGDALVAVPAGGDAYVLSNVIVTMDDGTAGTMLRNCRAVMGNGARLLLIEWVLPGSGGDTDDYAFWDTTTMDIVSLIVSGGSQGGHVRTEAEFRALLAGAGLQLAAIVPTSSSVKVLEAVPDS